MSNEAQDKCMTAAVFATDYIDRHPHDLQKIVDLTNELDEFMGKKGVDYGIAICSLVLMVTMGVSRAAEEYKAQTVQ